MKMHFDEEIGIIFIDEVESTLNILDEEEYSSMETQIENLESENNNLIKQLEQLKTENDRLTNQLEQSKTENSDITSQLNRMEEKSNEVLREVMKISLEAVIVDEIIKGSKAYWLGQGIWLALNINRKANLEECIEGSKASKAYWVGQGIWLALNINRKANLEECIDSQTLKLYEELRENAPMLCSAVKIAEQPHKFLGCGKKLSSPDNKNQS